MPRSRASAIIGFARAVASGELDLYRAESFDDTLARLIRLPGIGPWSAGLIAARVFDHADAFPAGDLGLRKGAAHLIGRAEALDPRELEQLSAAWRPWRTTAAAYLWLATAPEVAAGAGG
jgi:AraC family transcriptional regulator of adaptative response / DNA-3-methyladenine glycosylase II